MSEKERTLLSDRLSKSTNYLEYGSGGSTLLACSTPNIEKIHTVESDLKFINKLSNESSIAKNIQNNRLEFYFANTGETGLWGAPVDKKKKHFWPLYPLMPFADFKNRTNYDLVLIDGRFRVACALAVALENPNCSVLVHDYFRRPEYYILEKIYDIANSVDMLVELCIKKNVDSALLNRLFCKFCYLPLDRRGIYRLKSARSFLRRLKISSRREQ